MCFIEYVATSNNNNNNNNNNYYYDSQVLDRIIRSEANQIYMFVLGGYVLEGIQVVFC